MQPEQTYRDGIRAIVDAFPPLSPGVRDQLAAIFAPVLAKRPTGRGAPRAGGSRAA